MPEEQLSQQHRKRTATASKYREILNDFDAASKPAREAVRYLESLGFRLGQARSAVYQFRKDAGLVKSRRRDAQDDPT